MAAGVVPTWLQAIAQHLQQNNPTNRSLDVVEFFSGQGALHRACQEAGLQAVGFDVRHGPEQDILRETGLLHAVSLVLQIKANGLAWFAPQCSGWVFLSSSGHGRALGNNFEGRETERSSEVEAGNSTACIVSALVLLAASRGVAVVVEQPSDSCMYKFTSLRTALNIAGANSLHTWLAGFCDQFPCPKPLVLKGTSSWLGALYRNKPSRTFNTEQVYKKGIDGKVSGGPMLSSTSAYPWEFGQAVCTFFHTQLHRSRVSENY